MQAAFFVLEGLAFLEVDAVGGRTGIVLRAVICQNESRVFRKRHRQVGHVTVVVDLDRRRLKIDRLAFERPEKIRKRNVDTRLRLVVPKDFEDQAAIELPAAVVGDVKVGHLSGPGEIRKHRFAAFGDADPVVFHVAVETAVRDMRQAAHLAERRGARQKQPAGRHQNGSGVPGPCHMRQRLSELHARIQ